MLTEKEEILYQALLRTTQAIKDIISAADNKEPYSSEELQKNFLEDYNAGYDAIEIICYNEGFENVS